MGQAIATRDAVNNPEDRQLWQDVHAVLLRWEITPPAIPHRDVLDVSTMPDSEVKALELLSRGERETGRGYLFDDRRFLTMSVRTRLIPNLPDCGITPDYP
ncbi:hypothetical protein PG996_000367 [Apiospora saccharicola]|uniref:Uncharacterized protein n=1 Tax=Apiospora saccharicola TaxID=335842 RepID=A0ABR1WDJ8_9PEZI